PEGRVEPRVELVVHREEIANVVPLLAVVSVVKLDERRRRFAKAVEQRVRQRAGLDADDLQGCGFERLDKAGGIANGHNISDPGALVASGPKPHDARLDGDLGVLPKKLGKRCFVADEGGRIDVATVDEVL